MEALTKRKRKFQKQKEQFDALSDKQKKVYDAKVVLSKLKRKFKGEKFKLDQYFDTTAKCVFLSTDSGLLNQWQREGNYMYDDGLNKDFANYLRKNELNWFWDSPKGEMSWHGIKILLRHCERTFS